MRLLNPFFQCISETRHLLQTKILYFHSKSQLDHHLRTSTHLDSTTSAHCALFKTGFIHDPYTANHLQNSYIRTAQLSYARNVFDEMGEPNLVSWTSLITGYVKAGRPRTGLGVYSMMMRETSIVPNSFTLSIVISACSADADVENGSAKYGHGMALELFKEMLEKKITPNAVTYVGVLHACSHSGLANEGLRYLTSMQQEHGIVPDSRHQNCVVDMLGRIGRLDEAYKLAQSSQANMDQGALLWGTLLSASRLHKRVDIAVEASKWLIASKQQVAAAYVTMSNAYAMTGNWDNAGKLRSQMKHNGVSKEPGCSWVEIKDSVYIFYANNLSYCPRRDEVLNLLSELGTKLKQKGYSIRSNNHMLVDIEEETTQEMLGLHSERLALAFAFISIPKGVTIRVMKNLRMCTDCHMVFKMISEVVGRDIVVRDVNRFHHFSNGSCTCGDFW